ncbi:MAG: CAF17-like 4Fe-4S cluster assembly/insertion protein YgfZ [Hyphococcus sp.]
MSMIEHLPDRTVIRISGADRRDFLQGLVTQDMEALTPETALFAALLTPQGKILFDFFLIEQEDCILADCATESAAALAKRLTLYKLRAKVGVDVDDTVSVFAGVEAPPPENVVSFPDPRLAALGWRAIVPMNADMDGKAEAKTGAYEARRIALGVPEYGKDFGSDEVFLLDVNYDALNGVSYKKGCFVGQEVTSRMKRKGDVRKRTLIAAFDSAPGAKSAAVIAGDSTLGQMMSGAESAGLALIRLDRWRKAEDESASPTCEGLALRLAVPGYLEHS